MNYVKKEGDQLFIRPPMLVKPSDALPRSIAFERAISDKRRADRFEYNLQEGNYDFLSEKFSSPSVYKNYLTSLFPGKSRKGKSSGYSQDIDIRYKGFEQAFYSHYEKIGFNAESGISPPDLSIENNPLLESYIPYMKGKNKAAADRAWWDFLNNYVANFVSIITSLSEAHNDGSIGFALPSGHGARFVLEKIELMPRILVIEEPGSFPASLRTELSSQDIDAIFIYDLFYFRKYDGDGFMRIQDYCQTNSVFLAVMSQKVYDFDESFFPSLGVYHKSVHESVIYFRCQFGHDDEVFLAR